MNKLKVLDMPKTYLFQKGERNPMFGKTNELSPSWKGDSAGYQAIHMWVRKNKPRSDYCEECNKKEKLEVSNLSGKNKRDINDYKWLCVPCHRNKDNKKAFIGKLTKDIIMKIRKDYGTGDFFQRHLAEKYNINQSTISRILNKKRGRYIW